MTTANQALAGIFAADRSLREHEESLLQAEPGAVRKLLIDAVTEAKGLSDRQEAVMRLERLADLCAQIEGPGVTDALIAILDDPTPSVRLQAAEALADVGFDRYAEFARGVERALSSKQEGPAMQELPWILCEIAEPSARPLIARFLQSKNVEVAASAVEALAELGDPSAIKDLEPFESDSRTIEIEDDGEGIAATLGDLVSETIESLRGND